MNKNFKAFGINHLSLFKLLIEYHYILNVIRNTIFFLIKNFMNNTLLVETAQKSMGKKLSTV